MNQDAKAAERRKLQRESIEKLVADSVRMAEYEPGKFWALINLPSLSSKTIYKGCVEGHAKMLCEIARAAMVHALQYATLTSEGIGEEAYAELHDKGFAHYAMDYKRHGIEIANAIAAVPQNRFDAQRVCIGLDLSAQQDAISTVPPVDSVTPAGERDAEGSGDSRHPSFLTVSPAAMAELQSEVERG